MEDLEISRRHRLPLKVERFASWAIENDAAQELTLVYLKGRGGQDVFRSG